MGVLDLECLVQNGTRMVGMAYASRVGIFNEGYNTHVLLIQSNPSPPDLESVAWDLVSSHERWTMGPRDPESTKACHSDPETGIFAMISMFEVQEGNRSPIRQPGGFLYDSFSGAWTNFTLSMDYRWGSSYLKPNSFVLFRPNVAGEGQGGGNNKTSSSTIGGSTSIQKPTQASGSSQQSTKTTTSLPSGTPTGTVSKPLPHSALFFHANIGSGNSVNIGLLPNDGTYKMINWEQWELDPQIFGFPVLLAFAKKSLFQVGTKIEDNRTGERKFYLTRIPIRDNFMFSPTSNYSVIPLPEFTCKAESMMAKPYQDNLYIICLTAPHWIIIIKDEENAQPAIYQFISPAPTMCQPIGGDLPEQEGFLYCFDYNGVFKHPIKPPYNSRYPPHMGYWVNITHDYGYLPSDRNPIPFRTDLAVTGSVAVLVLITMAILYRPIKRRWPRWRDQWRRRLLDQISSDAEIQGNHKDNPAKETSASQSTKMDPKESAKIEIPSRENSSEFEGQDKILVTCDEDLVGVMNLAEPLATQEDDMTDRHVGDLDLDHHTWSNVMTNHSRNGVEVARSTSISLHESLPVPTSTPALLVAPPIAIASGKEQLTLLLSPLPSNYTPSALPSAPLADYLQPLPLNNPQPLIVQTIPRNWESTDIPSSSITDNTEYTLPNKEDNGASRHVMDGMNQNTDAEDVDEEDRVPPYVKQPVLSIPPPSASHLEQHLPSAPSLAVIEGSISGTELEPPPSLPSTDSSTDSIYEPITRIATIQGQGPDV